MKVKSSAAAASRKGPAEWFTGTVWIDQIVEAEKPSRVRLARVSFEPGARTAWHTHPLGQVLHVLSGSGLVQEEGGPVREIHPGDTVEIPPHACHWHGAGPANTMVHLALQEANDEGVHVSWMEHVTDEQYTRRA
jgi:quercetin dioxygenase-like cupin family protein